MHIKGKILLTIWATLFPLFVALASDESSHPSQIIYRAETRASFSEGENTPFWLVSNIHGLGAPELNNGYVRGEIFKDMDTHKRFDWGFGADLTGAWNLPAPFAIRQLYAELHYRAFTVGIGSKNYSNGYNDRRLSSGDLLFSGNAMAIPQVRIGTNDFAYLGGAKSLFAVKAFLGYGFFTDSKWLKKWVAPGTDRTSDVLFCDRGVWFRIGNFERFPLTFDIGIEMGTQFGGTIYKNGKTIKMPHGFIDWVKAVIPLAGSDDTPVEDQTNVQGNMNGEYTMSTSFSPAKGWDIRVYWEHYFEDHSQMTFEYGLWKDGLWGVEISFPRNPFVKKFVYEYIGTKDQTGAVNNDYTPEIPEQISGRDNYFNHYLYGCWQNWGMSIGTPLALSPLYNRSHLLTIYNTRFIAHHFGLEGEPVKNLNWRCLMTFSRNWGSYWRPLKDITNNWSGLVEATYNFPFLHGFFATGAIAWDHGHLLGNNFGGMISLGYEGCFNLKID